MREVYAMAGVEPRCRARITPGKLYRVANDAYPDSNLFNIIDDKGEERTCLWRGCGHLNRGNWRRFEEVTI